MFHEDSFSLDSFSTDSWLFLLEVPYFDLTRKQRVHVRHVLQSVYAPDVVESIVSVAGQILSVAAQSNLSVLDAIHVVTSRSSVETLIVHKKRKVSAAPQTRDRSERVELLVGNGPVYSVTKSEALYASATSETGYAFSAPEEIVSTSQPTALFIQHKPRRSSLEQS